MVMSLVFHMHILMDDTFKQAIMHLERQYFGKLTWSGGGYFSLIEMAQGFL
eukprot:c38318_g1_i1 orf=88-240(+)